MDKLRKWLLAAGLGLAGALSPIVGCSEKSQTQTLEQITEANQKLRNFPEQISGAKAVRKYEVDGAKYCLVHVRQEHSKEFENQRALETVMTKKDTERVNDIQKQISYTLAELAQKNVIDSVYLEGFSKELWQRVMKLPLESRMELCEIENHYTENLKNKIEGYERELSQTIIWDLPEGYTEETFRQEINEKKKKLSEELKAYKEMYKYVEGAALRAVMEGKLKPRFAENTASILSYDKFLETGVLGNDAYDGREDIVLELLAEGKEPLALTVYGSAHNFKDNIERWNALHPEMKFSLIEVDPEGIDEKQKLNKP